MNMIFALRNSVLIAFAGLLFLLTQSGSCDRNTKQKTSSENVNASVNESSKRAKSTDGPLVQNSNKNTSNSPNDPKSSSDSEEHWGGNHVRLILKPTGADIEFDCAHGEITEALMPDAEGHFDVEGTFQREGGPTRLAETTKGRPARYVGRVTKDSMTFQVHLKDTDQITETFTLARGSQGRLWKCR